MTSLIACLTTGKGSWVTVSEIIKSEEWESIFLITNAFGAQKYLSPKKSEFIIIEDNASSEVIRDMIVKQMKGKFSDTEIAVNMSSGLGSEHSALISAMLRLGLGVRLVDLINGKVVEV